jgi:flagellar motility protein MotE (MotC chaperone)
MSSAAPTRKQMILMDATASSIKGVLDNLHVQLGILEAQIKADERNKAEFERHLSTLNTKKSELEARVRQNEEWAKKYDTEVGPFADRYKQMTADIGTIYERAKVGHAKGIVLLEKEFGYHPAFKRPGDSFFGIPFRPI